MNTDEIIGAGVAVGVAGLALGMASKVIKNIDQPIQKQKKGKKSQWL